MVQIIMGVYDSGDEYNLDVLEGFFLDEKFKVFSRILPNIVSCDRSIKRKYILDTDLGYFHKLSVFNPTQYSIFSKLIKMQKLLQSRKNQIV